MKVYRVFCIILTLGMIVYSHGALIDKKNHNEAISTVSDSSQCPAISLALVVRYERSVTDVKRCKEGEIKTNGKCEKIFKDTGDFDQ